MTPTGRLRVGFIGANGRWGPSAHAPALQRLPETELYAVCTAHADTAQAAADKYGHDLKQSGILVVDSTKVVTVPSGNFAVHRLPIIETAKDTVGKVMVANIVSLGVIAGLSKVVSREAIEQAVLARVPRGTEELNRRALEEGFALAGVAPAA